MDNFLSLECLFFLWKTRELQLFLVDAYQFEIDPFSLQLKKTPIFQFWIFCPVKITRKTFENFAIKGMDPKKEHKTSHTLFGQHIPFCLWKQRRCLVENIQDRIARQNGWAEPFTDKHPSHCGSIDKPLLVADQNHVSFSHQDRNPTHQSCHSLHTRRASPRAGHCLTTPSLHPSFLPSETLATRTQKNRRLQRPRPPVHLSPCHFLASFVDSAFFSNNFFKSSNWHTIQQRRGTARVC